MPVLSRLDAQRVERPCSPPRLETLHPIAHARVEDVYEHPTVAGLAAALGISPAGRRAAATSRVAVGG